MAKTVYDVARHANVSIATVSRVVNKRGNVSAKTVRLVEKSIQELNFSPNVSAKSLMDRQSGTIGLVLPEMHGAFFSEVVRCMDVVARKGGRHLLISCSHDTKTGMEAGLAAMRGKVDGIVIMSPLISTESIEAFVRLDAPLVILNGDGQPTERFAGVSLDNYQGGYDMGTHLAAEGYRRVVVIMGPVGNRESDERRRGVEAGLRAAGVLEAPEILPGLFSEESGFAAGTEIADRAQRPDAVFALNDAMAIGCLSAFSERGIDVPGEIALAGFDDVPLSRFMQPTLTTIAVPVNELVTQSFQRLMEQLSADKSGVAVPRQQQKMQPELVVRRSTRRTG